MVEDGKKKPVTLADYIPPAPPPEPKRRRLSKQDRDRLEQIDQDLAEDQPNSSKRSRKKSRANQPRKTQGKKLNTLVFWAIILMLLFALIMG